MWQVRQWPPFSFDCIILANNGYRFINVDSLLKSEETGGNTQGGSDTGGGNNQGGGGSTIPGEGD